MADLKDRDWSGLESPETVTLLFYWYLGSENDAHIHQTPSLTNEHRYVFIYIITVECPVIVLNDKTAKMYNHHSCTWFLFILSVMTTPLPKSFFQPLKIALGSIFKTNPLILCEICVILKKEFEVFLLCGWRLSCHGNGLL